MNIKEFCTFVDRRKLKKLKRKNCIHEVKDILHVDMLQTLNNELIFSFTIMSDISGKILIEKFTRNYVKKFDKRTIQLFKRGYKLKKRNMYMKEIYKYNTIFFHELPTDNDSLLSIVQE